MFYTYVLLCENKTLNEAPLTNASGIFSSRFGAKSSEAENSSHSSTISQSRFSAKEDKRLLYVGFTSDLKSRISKHRYKSVKTTKIFDTISLIYYEACLNKTDARKRELQLKTGFGQGYIKRRLENYFSAGVVNR